jgi:hypothetical protein
MCNIPILLFSALLAAFRLHLDFQTEILALRHQIVVLKRSTNRPKLRLWDRFLWIWLLRFWPQWRSALVIIFAIKQLFLCAAGNKSKVGPALSLRSTQKPDKMLW